jgi:hypothetical protein
MNDFSTWKKSNKEISRGPELQNAYDAFFSEFD